MASIAISNFVGEMPRASTRLLPENAAQVATNCKLWSRELRPWRDFSTVNNPIKTGPIKTIYPPPPAPRRERGEPVGNLGDRADCRRTLRFQRQVVAARRSRRLRYGCRRGA